jgi:hypothetical protein
VILTAVGADGAAAVVGRGFGIGVGVARVADAGDADEVAIGCAVANADAENGADGAAALAHPRRIIAATAMTKVNFKFVPLASPGCGRSRSSWPIELETWPASQSFTRTSPSRRP